MWEKKKRTVKRLLSSSRKKKMQSWIRELVVKVWEIIRFWLRFLKYHDIWMHNVKKRKSLG